MADTTTETKAQKVERLKREKFAWARFDEIKEMASQGRAAVTPEWAGTYLRSWGIYTQGDGVGVIGGKNGEGKSTEYFMVRIRIPNGLLTSARLAPSPTLPIATPAASPTSPSARMFSSTGSPSNRFPNSSKRSGLPASPPSAPAATSPATYRMPARRLRRPRILRRLAPRARNQSHPRRQQPIITTCRASSRCPSPAAARGAIIPRSTTSASRP